MPEIDPDAMRALGEQYVTSVGQTIRDARTALTGSDAQAILTGNFTNVHVALAAVYVEAYHFADHDLQTKSDDATEFRDRLKSTADGWDGAEFHSTIKVDG